jgi:flagellar motor switch protein FliN
MSQNPDNSASNAQGNPPGTARVAGATGAQSDAQTQAALESMIREANEIAGQAAQPVKLPEFDSVQVEKHAKAIDLLSNVNLNVTIELGRTRLLVDDVLKLGAGTVVELDKLAGDPVDVYVNDRHVARGEVLVLNDNFCVRISEILAPVAA